jgi:ABC-type multidrug transport system ATPase subunit
MPGTRFGQIVIGPPGSGKTTFVKAMSDLLRKLERRVAIINLGEIFFLGNMFVYYEPV